MIFVKILQNQKSSKRQKSYVNFEKYQKARNIEKISNTQFSRKFHNEDAFEATKVV